ncbi:hypothetical protein A1Q2_06966 [Trichosporon asahii var. asahii CBS 8904]|uniref:Uncharacterized protein n=2 Tax=Trichosporon asahii var. asahii TaxID=189963 RepID=K1V441_TRIAC|nr:hypothetical protein A1Q1_06301 [Trichosporon asahii var. asahii CBS 2479]EJT52195.1 hypothetical protein A1Q1_06301 [Trichosporon asahii var. asahii CBS 2479]EKC98734.1 hypothetical protein A1Q2_06966 [Trichosporon asahii var. asahii CBS 8904]
MPVPSISVPGTLVMKGPANQKPRTQPVILSADMAPADSKVSSNPAVPSQADQPEQSNDPQLTHDEHINRMKTLGAPDWGIELMRQVLNIQDAQRASEKALQTFITSLRERQGAALELADSMNELAEELRGIVDLQSRGADNGPTPPHSPSGPSAVPDGEWGYIDLKLPLPKPPANLAELRAMDEQRLTGWNVMLGLGEDGTVQERQQRLADYFGMTE